MTKVLFFASLTDLVGTDEATVDHREELTVSQFLERVEDQHPRLVEFQRRFRVALNEEFVGNDAVVKPGAEVALIPPVSGGEHPHIRVAVSSQPLDMTALTEEVRHPSCGAVVTFLGTVRELTGEVVTDKLQYTAYEAMACKEMEKICVEAVERYRLGGAVVEHRVGELQPGDIAVIAACSSGHRQEAFEACRFLIDTTKERVPIWKKEFGPDGESWVEGPGRY